MPRITPYTGPACRCPYFKRDHEFPCCQDRPRPVAATPPALPPVLRSTHCPLFDPADETWSTRFAGRIGRPAPAMALALRQAFAAGRHVGMAEAFDDVLARPKVSGDTTLMQAGRLRERDEIRAALGELRHRLFIEAHGDAKEKL